jgi:hypothetical protein
LGATVPAKAKLLERRSESKSRVLRFVCFIIFFPGKDAWAQATAEEVAMTS